MSKHHTKTAPPSGKLEGNWKECRKPGRKPGPEGIRSAYLNVRMTPARRLEIEVAAARHGLAVPEFVRTVLQEVAR